MAGAVQVQTTSIVVQSLHMRWLQLVPKGVDSISAQGLQVARRTNLLHPAFG